MLPTIAKLASKHNIVPLKKYGQNFLFDETLCNKIVKYSDLEKDEIVLEIGPGTAGLTRSILKLEPQKLNVIETDIRCLPLLEEIKVLYPDLFIHHADALGIKLSDISKHEKIKIISNLPYNIGTVLLTNWLKEAESISSMTLMLQKEVVDRIISKPGVKSYGRLSVICQIICDIEKCFDVSPKAFYPPPKIWSSVVKLIPKRTLPDPVIFNRVEKITNLAFSGRRKMIKSSLKLAGADIEQKLTMLGLNSSLRAENLAPEDYLNLAKLLANSSVY